MEQKIHTTAQQRQLTKLLGYYFVIEYKPGKLNNVADTLTLSRQFNKEEITDQSQDMGVVQTMSLLAISAPIHKWLDEIKAAYAISHIIPNLLKKCAANELTPNSKNGIDCYNLEGISQWNS